MLNNGGLRNRFLSQLRGLVFGIRGFFLRYLYLEKLNIEVNDCEKENFELILNIEMLKIKGDSEDVVSGFLYDRF